MTLEEKLKDLKERFKRCPTRGITPLIKEFAKDPNSIGVLFNLTDADDATTYSLRKLYMCFLDDPTEIDFVDNVLFGKYDFLEGLKKNTQLSAFYKSIRTEAEQRRIAKNIKEISVIARGDDQKNKMAALKYLTDNSFNTFEATIKRGRPSKEEREGALKLAVKEMTEDEQDLARLLQ